MNTTAPKPVAPTSVMRHYIRYFNANVLSMALGFITFPVMARLLSKSQFGILGYFDTFALIWVAILKLGSQHSIIRFYPALARSPDEESRRSFYTSFVIAPAILSTALFLVSIVGVTAWMRYYPSPNAKYLYYVLTLGQLGVLTSLVENILRARELSHLAARVMVLNRILQSGTVIALLFLLERTATTVFMGRTVAGVFLVIALWAWFRRNCETGLHSFRPELFRQSLSFGIPLVSSELAMLTMAYVGRILLKELGAGFDDVGTYYLGYGMAMSIASILGGSVFQAFVPVANRLYEEEGAEVVQAAKQRVIRMLVSLSVLICCLLYFVGGDTFLLLAGPEKAASIVVFQWVGYTYAISHVLEISAYGLMLMKRSKTVMSVIFMASLLNIGLNLLLIPRFGIMGSVYSTLISYLAMGLTQNMLCPPELRTRLEWKTLGWPLVLGAGLAFIAGTTKLFGLEGYLPRILAMLALTVVAYVIPLVLIMKDFREIAARWLPFLANERKA